MARQKGEIGVASYGCWYAVVRGLESDCDRERGVARHEMRALRNKVADDEATLGAIVFTLVSTGKQVQTCCCAPSRSSTFSTCVA
jgi:hypothetical protein